MFYPKGQGEKHLNLQFVKSYDVHYLRLVLYSLGPPSCIFFWANSHVNFLVLSSARLGEINTLHAEAAQETCLVDSALVATASTKSTKMEAVRLKHMPPCLRYIAAMMVAT
jgi:hypothetical protein